MVMKRLMAEGYKQTEVGVIPEDWEVFDITSIVEKFIDYRGRTPKKLGMNWGGDILALSANNVQMGRIDRTKEANYGSGELYARWMTNGDCEYGDILMTMEAPLGNIAQINTNDKYILSQRVILIRPVKTVEKNYLAWFMKFDYFQNQLNINSSGSTAKGIQRSKLSKIKIYLPRIQDEQKAIATALSDVDNLITSLEQLIEKKKAIKQGTMQELLTGKRRLKGFGEGKGYKQTELGMIPEDWNCRKLGSIANIFDGTHQTPEYSISGIPFFSVENITTGSIKESKFITSSEHKRISKGKKIEYGDILMTRIGSIGVCKFVNWDFDASFYVSLALLKFENRNLSKYFYFFSFTNLFKVAIKNNSLLFAYPQKINLSSIGKVKIISPDDEFEQEAINSILSEMESAIEVLEKKFNKFKQIKQGMMQNLLSGRIRLK